MVPLPRTLSLITRVILPDRSSKTTLSKKTALPLSNSTLACYFHYDFFLQLATFSLLMHTVFPPQSYLKNKLHQE